MITQGIKTAVGVICYGLLLAIGFRLGQKVYEQVEKQAPDLITKTVKLTTEVMNDTRRRFSSGQEARN